MNLELPGVLVVLRQHGCIAIADPTTDGSGQCRVVIKGPCADSTREVLYLTHRVPKRIVIGLARKHGIPSEAFFRQLAVA